ncbi:hypothetical protein OIU77_012032 [Salix suchowensis]|uniref:Uncharacterized protein n=1 Tax=Salix suchowensis TaxID=1278906 RepID=A0ABQ9A291_9ROSI|nr:hypothetical protein OIU77_012032 [Salix suchowensis]
MSFLIPLRLLSFNALIPVRARVLFGFCFIRFFVSAICWYKLKLNNIPQTFITLLACYDQDLCLY